jgi:hypothetical protein
MKLTSMINFVKKQGNIGMEIQSLRHQQSDRARRFYLIQKYADFLLKDIKKGIFVPCDEFDNILEEPLQEHYTDCTEEQNAKDWLYNLEKYNQAKERVLFRDCISEFKVVDVRNGISYVKSISDDTGLVHLFWLDNITQTWRLSSDLTNIESLARFGIMELTETALKEIGFPKTDNND